MIPWNRHGIDWTAYDEEGRTGLCADGATYTAVLGILLILAGLVWWVAACP